MGYKYTEEDLKSIEKAEKAALSAARAISPEDDSKEIKEAESATLPAIKKISPNNGKLKEPSHKSNRLTKRQALLLSIVALVLEIINRKLILPTNNIALLTIGATIEVIMFYSFVSLCTKKGLRWK